MAPEIYMVKNNKQKRSKGKKSYSSKCDIWSLGTILFELLFGHSLVEMIRFKKGLAQLYQLESFLINKSKIPFPKKHNLSKDAIHLLECLLDKNPETRYNISQVLSHPWMKPKSEESSYKELLKSFYMVDDLQNGGEITKIFFTLKSRRYAICRLFLNEIMFTFTDIFKKVFHFLQIAVDLEARFGKINWSGSFGGEELKPLDWRGLFRACWIKVVYLVDKLGSMDFMLGNKLNHMISNFLIGNLENLKNYKLAMSYKKKVESLLGNETISELKLSRGLGYDTEGKVTCQEEEARINAFRGLLIWTEILNFGLLLEYRSPFSGLELIRPILLDCYQILDYDLSGIKYKIEYMRPIDPNMGPEIYDIEYFFKDLNHINQLYLFNSRGEICNNRYAANQSSSQDGSSQDINKPKTASSLLDKKEGARDIVFKKKPKEQTQKAHPNLDTANKNVKTERRQSGKGFNVYRETGREAEPSSFEDQTEDQLFYARHGNSREIENSSAFDNLLDSKPFFEEDEQMFKLQNLFSIRLAVENISVVKDKDMLEAFGQLNKKLKEYDFDVGIGKGKEKMIQDNLMWSDEEIDTRTVIRVDQLKIEKRKNKEKRYKDSNVSEFN